MLQNNICLTVVRKSIRAKCLITQNKVEVTLLYVKHSLIRSLLQSYIQCLLKTQFGESRAGEVNSELVHKLQITVRVVVGGDELCFDWSQANNRTQNTCFKVCERCVSGVLI